MSAPRQSGQALIVVLALVSTLVGALLLVFSSGQLVNDKIRLLNAADAAALSAAQVEARSLNYQAYLNRAIVANEVAIAQMVSLRAWSAYMDRTISNASRIGSIVPPLAAALQTLERGWTAVDRVIDGGASSLEAGLSHWNVNVLAIAQAVAQQQAPIAAADVVRQVTEANEPRAEDHQGTRLLEARNALDWGPRFSDRYRRGSGDLRRFTSLLMDSRDGFSASRSGNFLPESSVVQLSRRGGTDLVNEYSWRAIDTLSVHINLGITEQEIPVGWGAAEQRALATFQRGTHGGSLRRNPRASRLAQRELVPLQSYQGVPEIRGLVNPARQNDRAVEFSVALRLPARSISTADRLLIPAGFETVSGDVESLAPRLADDAVHAIGTAQVYYRRPVPRSDGRQEFPSLFEPYWQARLAETPTSARSITAPFRGLSIDPMAIVP